MFNKKFDRTLYVQNDNLAKLAGFYHLRNHTKAKWVSINPNDYGCDVNYRLDHDFDGPPLLLETEVKHTWKGGAFPFPTINVLQRKDKYFMEGADLLLLSGNKKDYLILTALDILGHDPTEIPNKYVGQMEFFRQVPLDKAKFYRFGEALEDLSVICTCGQKSYFIDNSDFICENCNRSPI
jgi:hypothetical protein